MKGHKTYLAECQVIRQTKNNDIPKTRQNAFQKTANYNTKRGLLQCD